MAERVTPWWRKALDYAMNGIRSLLGGGRVANEGDGGVASAPSNGQQEEPKIELAVKQIFPPLEVIADEVMERASLPEVAAAQEAPVQVDEAPEPVDEAAAPPARQNLEEQTAVMQSVDKDFPEPDARIESVDAMPELMPLPSSDEPSVVEVKESTGSHAEPEVDLVADATHDTAAEVKAILEAVDEVEAESVAAHAVWAVTAAEMDSKAISSLEMIELAVEKANPEVKEVKAEAEPSLSAEAAQPVEAEAAPSLEAEESAAVPVASAEPDSAPVVEEEPAPAATEPEATSEEASKVEAPQPVAVKTEAEQKTAARVAAAIKAREDSADPSPFSIFVGQVYDGPLDLLLDLIRKQDIDIYDIPIAKITAQFLAYVNQLKASDMDVAGEFIYTASLLIHIKSKMLLPRTALGPDDAAEDPRRELVERLLEHERFKNAAQMLQQKQMLEAATWTNPGVREFREDAGAEPEIAADTTDLVRVFQEILERARNRPIINVEEDSVTVGQMIQFLARRLTMEDKPVALHKLLSHTRSERALIAMFLALLELVRLQAILLRQDRQFSEIFVKKHSGFEAAMDQGLAGARDDWR